MDLLEDNWWPISVTASRPFSLPSSSKWLLKDEDDFITFVSGGDHTTYRMHQNCLPFLMLLDISQQMYLSVANSVDALQSETFYKGVMFLDSMRQDVMGQLRERDSPLLERYLPESMRRWLCRFLLSIPHDPENRKKNAVSLQKAYKDIDVFQYGMSFCLSPFSFLTIHQTSYIGH